MDNINTQIFLNYHKLEVFEIEFQKEMLTAVWVLVVYLLDKQLSWNYETKISMVTQLQIIKLSMFHKYVCDVVQHNCYAQVHMEKLKNELFLFVQKKTWFW